MFRLRLILRQGVISPTRRGGYNSPWFLLGFALCMLGTAHNAQARSGKQEQPPVLLINQDSTRTLQGMGPKQRVNFLRSFERGYEKNGKASLHQYGMTTDQQLKEQIKRAKRQHKAVRTPSEQKALQDMVAKRNQYSDIKAFSSDRQTAQPIRRRAPHEIDYARPYAVQKGYGFGDVGMQNEHNAGRGEVVYRQDDYRRYHVQQRAQYERDMQQYQDKQREQYSKLSPRDEVEYGAVAREARQYYKATEPQRAEELRQLRDREEFDRPFARRAMQRQNISAFDNTASTFQRDRYKQVYSNRFDERERAPMGSYSFSANDDAYHVRRSEFVEGTRAGMTDLQIREAPLDAANERAIGRTDWRSTRSLPPDAVPPAAMATETMQRNRQAALLQKQMQYRPGSNQRTGVYPLLGGSQDIAIGDRRYVPVDAIANPSDALRSNRPGETPRVGRAAGPAMRGPAINAPTISGHSPLY